MMMPPKRAPLKPTMVEMEGTTMERATVVPTKAIEFLPPITAVIHNIHQSVPEVLHINMREEQAVHRCSQTEVGHGVGEDHVDTHAETSNGGIDGFYSLTSKSSGILVS